LFGANSSSADNYADALGRVDQRGLFRNMRPIDGAAATLRRLDKRTDLRIRIITHRLIIDHIHQISASETVAWLDDHGFPYWDLCFMKQKGAVEADLYLEDTPKQIEALREAGKDVIVFTNSTNRDVLCPPGGRADDWAQIESLVIQHLETWINDHKEAA
jgi:5'(3')-deoxyribonucleotidase